MNLPPKFWLPLAAILLLASPFANAGHGHDDNRGRHGERAPARQYDNRHRAAPPPEFRFDDRHRNAIHDYYAPRFQSGRCPPGLRRSGPGCLPPGHDRRWTLNRPLPAGVVYYNLPPDVYHRLPPPPRGHRYVRVGVDILLITIGTGMVIDALQDIGGY